VDHGDRPGDAEGVGVQKLDRKLVASPTTTTGVAAKGRLDQPGFATRTRRRGHIGGW
jgi:hypothetical protein